MPVSKITHVVTDGGSAFCKAFRIYGRRTEESLLEENETENIIEIDDDSDELNLPMPHMNDSGEYFYSNELNFDGVMHTQMESEPTDLSFDEIDSIEEPSEYEIGQPNIDEAELITSLELPPQRGCGSHLLNLISNDFEKELKGPSKTSLVTAVSKLHASWVLTARSSAAKKICFDITGYTLQVPCVTRWNSKFDSIEKSLKVFFTSF